MRRSAVSGESPAVHGSGPAGPSGDARRRKLEHLSNIKFIGELGKLDLLHEQILHRCVQELLDNKSSPSIQEKAEDLECLCQMMRIIGNSLDSKPADKIWMDDYIHRLKEYSESDSLPSRIRFLCLDIVELRSNKWFPRRIQQANAPKTMIEIREEIRAEIGASKEGLDLAPRLSPQRGGSALRQSNSPRTVAEKQQDSRNGTLPQVRYNKGDYNRGMNSPTAKQAPGVLKDNRKSVLKLLSQDSSEIAGQEIILRPLTSFNPQRPQKPTDQSIRNVKEMQPVPSVRVQPSPAVMKDEVFSPRVEKPKPVKAVQMNKSEAAQAISTIVTTYFDNAKDRLHAVANIKELSLPKRLKTDLLGVMLKMGMEHGEVNREKISELIVHLTCESWITENDVIEGYQGLLEVLDSGTCDPKPCMAVYLADFITSGILSFKNGVQLFERGHHFPIGLMCLQHLEQIKGPDYLSEQILSDGLDFLKLFPENQQSVEYVVETLNTYGLTYLCPAYRLQAQLGKLLSDGATAADIEQWLQDNANSVFHTKSDFVYSLLISLVKHIHYQSVSAAEVRSGDTVEHTRIKEDKFKICIVNYKKLFHQYLDSPRNQLVALYAVQAFYHGISFPKGWILCWFCVLHELDIVEQETFNIWRDEVNDVYPGKGKALFQVSAWLEWLNTIESESEEDAENENNQAVSPLNGAK